MSEELVKASFDPHLNDNFEVHLDEDVKVKVELVEVSDHSQENTEAFSVVFK